MSNQSDDWPYAALPTFICGNYAWLQDPCLSMQQRPLCRASLLVISTTATLCSVASQTVCSGAYSLCRTRAARLVTSTRRRDHITPVLRQLHWLPVRQRVDFKLALLVYKALHDATAAYLVDNCQLVSSRRRSRRLSPATIGQHRHCAFHGPTHSSAIGASQPLDHSSGTVCQPGFVSPTTTSENFVGSWSRFCLIDTTAHSDNCSYVPVKYSYSLTHITLSCDHSHCTVYLQHYQC